MIGWAEADQNGSSPIESSGDGIALADLDGRVTHLNPVLMKLSGHSVESLNQAHGLGSLYRDPARLKKAMKLARLGQSWSGRLKLAGSGEDVEQARVVTHPLRNGKG